MTNVDSIDIYTDGSCLSNPGPGGWGVIILYENREQDRLSGADPHTTNNRMEMTAAIKGLEATPTGTAVVVNSDSEYLVKTMTLNWKRRKNHDLWGQLDSLSESRSVTWSWVRGHNGDHWNTEADRLAVSAAKSSQVPRHKQ